MSPRPATDERKRKKTDPPPSSAPHAAGTIFLFDRKAVRFFRKDGHDWQKKKDGKTVRETHEKLKVGNVELLNCYYAHAAENDRFQRRCYWLLDSDEGVVLVHYLDTTMVVGGRGGAKGAGLGPRRGGPRRGPTAAPPTARTKTASAICSGTPAACRSTPGPGTRRWRAWEACRGARP